MPAKKAPTDAEVRKMVKADLAKLLKQHKVKEEEVKTLKVAEMREKYFAITKKEAAKASPKKRKADEEAVDEKPAKKAKKDDTQPHVPGLIEEGARVEGWTVDDHEGKQVSLSDYKGKKLIVFFYPKASTPGCTAEACSLRDHHEALTKAGYHILGVSADNVKAQKNFVTKQELPYPLLADVDKKVLKAFGVWGKKTFMGRTADGIRRSTFLVNEAGVVEKVFSKVVTKTHGQQILDSLE